jgi:hypothetical protein
MSHFTSLFDYRPPENDDSEQQEETSQREESIPKLSRRQDYGDSEGSEDEQNYRREYDDDWTRPKKPQIVSKFKDWYDNKGGKEKLRAKYQENKTYNDQRYDRKKKKWTNKIFKAKTGKEKWKDRYYNLYEAFLEKEQKRRDKKNAIKEKYSDFEGGVISRRWEL